MHYPVFSSVTQENEPLLMDDEISEGQKMLHMLSVLWLATSLTDVVDGITCYTCKSDRDFRCLDPFDHGPFVQVSKAFLRFAYAVIAA